MKRVVVGVGLVAVAIAFALWHSCGGRADEATHAVGSASHVGHAAHVDPRKQPRASIEGTVSDANHAPIAGARVCAIATNHETLPRAMIRDPRCSISDAHGAYAVASLPATTYYVSAMARSFKPMAYHSNDPGLELHAGEAKTGVDLAMERGGAEVDGTVSDRSGGPIPRAVVTIAGHGDGTATVETDEAGHYVAWVEAALVTVTASADGYASESALGAAPGWFDLALLPEATIEGTVVDLKTSEPAAGVRIFASRELGAWVGEPDDVTDEDGRFKLDRLRPARYTILARGAHGAGTADRSYAVIAAQVISGLVIRLGPTYRIDGKVVVADAPGTICKQPYLGVALHTYEGDARSRVGSGGSVSVDGVIPGTYEVRASCPGFIAKDSQPKIEITDHDVSGLVWEVETGATIRGHVRTKSGEPIANATVADADVDSVSTNADGSYALSGLSPGTHVFTAFAENAAPTRSSKPVTLTGKETVDQDFVLEPGGVLHGTIVDPSGKPLPGVRVDFSPVAKDTHQYRDPVMTDSTGSFVFPPVASGEYAVAASLDGDVARQAFSIEAPHTTTVHLILTLGTRGTIRGIVVDAHGVPAGDAMVSIGRESEYFSGPPASRYYDRNELPASDGTFVFDKLREGLYTIRAQRGDGSVAYAEHVALGGKVSLALEAVGSIDGEVRGLPGAELLLAARDSKSDVRRTERLIYSDGHFAIRALPPGHYIVTARANRQTLTQEVTLARGEHKKIVFEASPGVMVTGRVIDLATGLPIADRKVIATVTRGEFGDFDDFPVPISTDTAGRFRIEQVPTGIVQISAEGDTKYAGSSIVRSIRSDTDVGDLGATTHRTPATVRTGKLGITWMSYPDDVPSDQRQFEIAAIDPKGAAAGTELRVGDVVTTFDGIDAKPNNRSACWAILDAPAGTTIKLGLARGPIVTVVLAPP